MQHAYTICKECVHDYVYIVLFIKLPYDSATYSHTYIFCKVNES